MGRNLVPWQEEVVGNNPTDRNPRRAAGDGDPARTSGTVLERERETEWGERRMGMGELELPLLVFNPPRALYRMVVPHVIAVLPPRAEVPHHDFSTAPPGASKKLLPRWVRKYRALPTQ